MSLLFNTTDRYGSVAKFFHWLMALLIIGLLMVGFFMDDIGNNNQKMIIYNSHKLFGLLVLCLAILRVIWYFLNITPGLPDNMPMWEKVLEKLIKLFLYLVLFLMPCSGWITASAGGHFPHIGQINLIAPFVSVDKNIAMIAKKIHGYIAWGIVILLFFHIAGALKHHFIHKDEILKRMMPKR